MPYRYLGRADFFGYQGKFYTPGQMVPISKEEALHHVQQSNARFEGIDPASGDDVPAAQPLPGTEARPVDDRGVPIPDAPMSQGPAVTPTAPPSAPKSDESK